MHHLNRAELASIAGTQRMVHLEENILELSISNPSPELQIMRCTILQAAQADLLARFWGL